MKLDKSEIEGAAEEITIRVRYAETDQMKVAHHAAYLVWFEEARTQLCRSRGVTYRDMEANQGLFLPVVEVKCRYGGPARYDELLTVEVRVAELSRRSVRFRYRVLRGETALAEAETYHILVDAAGRPRVWPDEVVRALRGAPDKE